MKKYLTSLLVCFSLSAQATQNKCQSSEFNATLESLYRGSVQTACSVNYMWKLLGIEKNPRKDPVFCTLAFEGIATAGLAAHYMHDGIFFDRWVHSNNPSKRAHFKSMSKSLHPGSARPEFGEARSFKYVEYREIYELMEKHPDNFIIARDSGSYPGFNPKVGPHKNVYVPIQGALKAARAVAIGAATAGVFVITESTLASTSTACDQASDRYLLREAGSSCKTASKSLNSKVLDFLNLPTNEQKKTIEDDPSLCEAYADISKNLEKNIGDRYSVRGIDTSCTQNGTTTKIEFKDSAKSEIYISGDKATIYTDSTVYDVEYRTDENGNRVLKSFVGQNKVNQNGVFSAPYQYNFPAKNHQVQNQRFQKDIAEVSRNTMALERSGAFNKCGANKQTNEQGTKAQH